RIVAGIQKAGLKKFKAFPKGTPVPDGLRVTGAIDAGEVNRFLSDVLLKTPRLGGVVVFPYGIPWPEIFRGNIEIRATGEKGSVKRFCAIDPWATAIGCLFLAGLPALPGGQFSRYTLRSGAICLAPIAIPVPVRWRAQGLMQRPSVRSSLMRRRWATKWFQRLAESR